MDLYANNKESVSHCMLDEEIGTINLVAILTNRGIVEERSTFSRREIL